MVPNYVYVRAPKSRSDEFLSAVYYVVMNFKRREVCQRRVQSTEQTTWCHAKWPNSEGTFHHNVKSHEMIMV